MSSHVVARIAWLVPLILAGLTFQQGKAALDLHETLVGGEEARAVVLRYLRSDRKDVTQAELDLRVTLRDGTTITREHLALPYTIAHRVESDSVDVRVLRGSGQEIVLTAIGETQRRIALTNCAMSAIMLIIAFAGVFAWNRSLRTPDGAET